MKRVLIKKIATFLKVAIFFNRENLSRNSYN